MNALPHMFMVRDSQARLIPVQACFFNDDAALRHRIDTSTLHFASGQLSSELCLGVGVRRLSEEALFQTHNFPTLNACPPYCILHPKASLLSELSSSEIVHNVFRPRLSRSSVGAVQVVQEVVDSYGDESPATEEELTIIRRIATPELASAVYTCLRVEVTLRACGCGCGGGLSGVQDWVPMRGRVT